MITEIPTAADFHTAGLNQLYLAWRIAMTAMRDFEEMHNAAEHLNDKEANAAAAEYWTKLQPALGNAFGLIQQATEMSLKGRIVEVSPFLLINRDPKDWPSNVDKLPIPFSQFRTLDAADLVKVHNTFSVQPLSEQFREFWEQLRRDRNTIMHSVSAKPFEPAVLIRSVLIVAITLFSEKSWPAHLISMEGKGAYATYGYTDDDYNVVMDQIDAAMRLLTPAEKRDLFGFDHNRRGYTCPSCWNNANHDWQEQWPKLAQLRSRSVGERRLHCIVCDTTSEVLREGCVSPDCKGNVINEDVCLTCLREQDAPTTYFPSYDRQKITNKEYSFSFERLSETRMASGVFKRRADAIKWAEQLMNKPALRTWEAVHIDTGGYASSLRADVGSWNRRDTELVWSKAPKAERMARTRLKLLGRPAAE